MPSANLSGEIFSFNADARYEGPVSIRGGAGGHLSVSLEAETCHGLSLDASAEALVEASAFLSFLLAGRASGFAIAAAGVSAKAQLKPDVFERLGLILDIAAYAEASAGGRLAVGLDFAALEQLGRQHLSGAALEIFLAFLREIVLEAGVWGRVGVAAMAQAHVDITLSLSEPEPGFIIEAGAAVGAGGGTGWDFYAAATFTDIDRFLQTTIRIITREAVREARRHAPGELNAGIEALEFLLPISMMTALELGQKAALGTLGPPETMVEPFVRSVATGLRDYLLKKVIEAARNEIQMQLERATDAVLRGSFTDLQIAAIESEIQGMITFLQARQDADPRIEDVVTLGASLLELGGIIFPEEVSVWRRPVATLWSAFACVNQLHEAAASVTGSASIVGLGGVEGPLMDFDELPEPPTMVREAFEETLGRDLILVRFADALDYLGAVGVLPLLGRHVPAAGPFLDQLSDVFGLTVGELVESGLRLSVGADMTRLEAYRRVRRFAQDQIDGVIQGELLPELRRATGPAGREYISEVAEPSLASLSVFVFDRLDAIVNGVATGDQSPFLEKLSAGCSAVVYRVVMRNVLFLENLLFEHVLDQLTHSFGALAQAARQDPHHVMVSTLQQLLPTTSPAIPFVPGRDVEALQQLIADLAEIGGDAFGSEVWSPRRRAIWRDLKRDTILGLEGSDPFADRRAVETLLTDLVLCDHIPNEAALEQLTSFLGDVLADSAGVLVPRSAIAVSRFLLAITKSTVIDIDRSFRKFLFDLADAIDAALRELDRWVRAVEDAIDAAKEAARDFQDALGDLEDILRSPSRRDEIRDALYLLGAAEVERGVRSLGGDSNAVAAAIGAYWVAFQAAVPLINLAMDAGAAVANGLEDSIDSALNSANALDAIIRKTITNAQNAVFGGTTSLGISLPQELSAQDIAKAIVDALPTEAILDLIDFAMVALGREEAALIEEAFAERERDNARAELERRREAEAEALPSGPVEIQIWGPVALPDSLKHSFRYGPKVPVVLRLRGAGAPAFARGRGRRVRIGLNGMNLHYESSEWTEISPRLFEFRRTLSAGARPLLPGMNVLEVTVVDGAGTILRTTAAFIVDPAAPAIADVLVVDARASLFDTPGNDHAQLAREKVFFRWAGPATLPLDGWRVQDRRGRHRYALAGASIAAGGVLGVVSGGDPAANQADLRFWGRKRAVWNNDGDVVCLVDDRAILRAVHVYLPPA
jgi:hypothetical protein